MDYHLYQYLTSNRNKEPLEALLYHLGWAPDLKGLQYLFAILNYSQDDEPVCNLLLNFISTHFTKAIQQKLNYLRGYGIRDEIKKEIFRSVFTDMSRQSKLKHRIYCQQIMAIAERGGLEDVVKKAQEFMPKNLALGAKVWSDGFDERSPSNAVNGVLDKEDYWAAYNWPRTLTVDLGSVQQVSRVDLHFFYNIDGGRSYSYELFASSELAEQSLPSRPIRISLFSR